MRADLLSRAVGGIVLTTMVLGVSFVGRPALAAGFDYCTVGQKTSLFVVDRTTRFDRTDQDILVAAADSFFRNQDPGERVIVAAVSGAYTDIRLVLNECRPGCPETNILSQLLSTCRPVIARGDYLSFERRFIASLLSLLKQDEEASASDLFRSVAEATRLIASNGYKPLRQMVLYSDLLEASSVLPQGQIRRMAPTDVLRRLERDGIDASLRGATVKVVGFGRDDGPTRPALAQDVRRRVEETWRQWLTKSGGQEVQVGLR
ncbi:hypothetical protein EAH89_18795 [Roseomonas nepalensis]|uniref:VWA domain-containing protein n=1 Tax=Muricoccus nepalensis TaxID=1854500 RepID=A0A502FRZ2_9PROT|nr:hypothetical protein [Roseomonas nepalensis]TPG52288.1 hypothetical protein EAH89_18795 [Roseomonas nepalensis]